MITATEEDIQNEFEALRSNKDPRFERLRQQLSQGDYQLVLHGTQQDLNGSNPTRLIIFQYVCTSSITGFKGLTIYGNPENDYGAGLQVAILDGGILTEKILDVRSTKNFQIPNSNSIPQEHTSTSQYLAGSNGDGLFNGVSYSTIADKLKISGKFELKKITF